MIAFTEGLGGAPIDSSNLHGVGMKADGRIIITSPRWGLEMFSPVLDKEGALNLAAWLSLLADPDGKEFDRIREAIKRT